VAVSDVAVEVQTIDSLGATANHRRRLQQLAPGATALVLVRENAAALVDARAAVVAARVQD
jgi:hypothetical protein